MIDTKHLDLGLPVKMAKQVNAALTSTHSHIPIIAHLNYRTTTLGNPLEIRGTKLP